jgi:formylglycine-generating enzyme required for sulfatase activity
VLAEAREEGRSKEEERERLVREQEEEEQRKNREGEERRALAEAERWKAEAERLAREKEALERKAEQERVAPDGSERSKTEGSLASSRKEAAAPMLRRLEVLAGSLVSDGTGFFDRPKWRVETRPVEPECYREELGDGVALTMIRIPAGGFVMGSPNSELERRGTEGPQHSVRLEEFFLGQTPITQGQWQVVACCDRVERDLNPDPSTVKGAKRPVETVSWNEAMEFCRRLSLRTGRRYGLPSEAQWEYACRAGTTTPFAFGQTITPELANYVGNFTYGDGPKGTYRQQTTDVGTFPANAWGLQDMHGNVWEWCMDHMHESYEGAPGDGRPWLDPAAAEGAPRLLRGGSWCNVPWICRSASRVRFDPDARYYYIGFRVCCLPPGPS